MSKTLETGEAWQETKIFDGGATLDEVMLWADPQYCYSEKTNKLPDWSRKRVTLTKPRMEEA